jgi:hypothetical protein
VGVGDDAALLHLPEVELTRFGRHL